MDILRRTNGGIRPIDIETQHLEHRRIFIEGEIDYTLSCKVVKEIMHLCDEDTEKPIDVFVTSPGGDVGAGLLIYDAIHDCDCTINTVCLGQASSMGAVIFAAGTGSRSILLHSRLMIHEPYVAGAIQGNSKEIRSVAESILATKQVINQILSEITSKSVEEIEKATAYDNYLSAEDAVEFGLADKVIRFYELIERYEYAG